MFYKGLAVVLVSFFMIASSPFAEAVSITSSPLSRVPNVQRKAVYTPSETMQPINVAAPPQADNPHHGDMIVFPNTPMENWPLWMQIAFKYMS